MLQMMKLDNEIDSLDRLQNLLGPIYILNILHNISEARRCILHYVKFFFFYI
jgi:hypothetical protein